MRFLQAQSIRLYPAFHSHGVDAPSPSQSTIRIPAQRGGCCSQSSGSPRGCPRGRSAWRGGCSHRLDFDRHREHIHCAEIGLFSLTLSDEEVDGEEPQAFRRRAVLSILSAVRARGRRGVSLRTTIISTTATTLDRTWMDGCLREGGAKNRHGDYSRGQQTPVYRVDDEGRDDGVRPGAAASTHAHMLM